MTEQRTIPALGWVVVAVILATPPLVQIAAGPLALGMGGRGGAALLVPFVLAPWIEELVMRPLLQRGLVERFVRRGASPTRAAWMAGVASTVVFALVHLPDWSLGGVRACAPWLLPGAALAATWCWRRRTLDCVLLHAFFNVALWLAGPG
ncbi:MAG: CPBP family intramembrane metalloprotease [Ideonella sp.]|nr:CPBP family intramembrane metalloprotease [Ideonella sp.]